MSAYSDTDDNFYAKSENYYQSDIHCDFLSFLGIAQTLKIDFLPITWQPALENVGHGGTAEIRQALVNLQMSFAFKRLTPAELPQSITDETKSFRTLIAEISVLGHPSIRDHPNIIRLEGICWDVVPGGEKVWPVLVFEKARHGDLHTFMEQAEGKRLTLEERLNVCADIAMAVNDMHSNGA
jgi:serine/threonine protein kinase